MHISTDVDSGIQVPFSYSDINSSCRGDSANPKPVFQILLL